MNWDDFEGFKILAHYVVWTFALVWAGSLFIEIWRE